MCSYVVQDLFQTPACGVCSEHTSPQCCESIIRSLDALSVTVSSEPPVWGRQKGVTLFSSDFFRFAPFSSGLFRFVCRTNQNKSGKPLSADPFCKSPISPIFSISFAVHPHILRGLEIPGAAPTSASGEPSPRV